MSKAEQFLNSCQCGDLETASKLRKKVDINTQNVDGRTGLMLACIGGYVDIVSQLLSAKKIKVDLADSLGLSALHHAAKSGNKQIIEILLKAKPAVNLQTREGLTPLYLACQAKHEGCGRLLLTNGASLGDSDTDRWPLLATAIDRGEIEACRTLLRLGARHNLKQSSTLHMACLNDKADVLKILIASGAFIDRQDAQGATALLIASSKGHLDCVNVLLDNKANVNLANKSGWTPLHFACDRGREGSVKLLCEKGGASVDVMEGNGRRPVDLARNKGHTGCVQMLMTYESKGKAKPLTAGARPESDAGRQLDCGYHKACRTFVQSLDLPDVYFDPVHDVCYCVYCQEGSTLYYPRGDPPKDYGIPIGWAKFGLLAPAKAKGLEVFEKWHVAFHGTRKDCVRKILNTADLLIPGDISLDGVPIKPPSNHYTQDGSGIEAPAGHDINKIYLSPSIKYSGNDVYSPPVRFEDSTNKKKYRARVAFQVRIKPDSYDVSDQTIGRSQRIDPKFPNCELEWSTKCRGVIVLVGLLVRLEGYDATQVSNPRQPCLRQ